MFRSSPIKTVFLVTIFLAPLYLVRLTFFNVPTNIFELFMLLSLFAFIVNKRKQVFFVISKNKFLFSSIMLFIFGVILSTVFNGNYLAGAGILKSWIFIPILFSIALFNTVEQASDFDNVLKAVFYSSVAVSAISLFYVFFDMLTFDGRLSSFYLSPNHLAMYIAPGLLLGCFFCMKSFMQKKHSPEFLLNVLLTSIIAIVIYCTYSYGAWLALLSSAIFVFFASPLERKYKLLGILLPLFLLMLMFIFQSSSQKFSDIANLSQRSSLASRHTIWQVSKKLISENPIFGIGPGNFQTAYLSQQQYFPPYLEWAVPQPHNIFLAFWLQAGLLGLGGFFLLLLYVFSSLGKIMQNKNAAMLAAPILGFFLYTIFHGLIDTPFWKNDLAFLFWLFVFSVCFLRNSEKA